MVEMVVRDQDEVDAPRLLRCKRRRNQPFGVRAEEGVDERGGAAETQRDARLAKPGEHDRAWRELVPDERLERCRGGDDHAGLSCTFRASPSRSVSAAKAAACSSRGN